MPPHVLLALALCSLIGLSLGLLGGGGSMLRGRASSPHERAPPHPTVVPAVGFVVGLLTGFAGALAGAHAGASVNPARLRRAFAVFVLPVGASLLAKNALAGA